MFIVSSIFMFVQLLKHSSANQSIFQQMLWLLKEAALIHLPANETAVFVYKKAKSFVAKLVFFVRNAPYQFVNNIQRSTILVFHAARTHKLFFLLFASYSFHHKIHWKPILYVSNNMHTYKIKRKKISTRMCLFLQIENFQIIFLLFQLIEDLSYTNR